MKMAKYQLILASAGMGLFVASCGSSSGGSSAGTALCTTPGTTVTLPEEITEATHLTADCDYLLNQNTFVTNDSLLTIDAGTVIKGDKSGGETPALIITRGSQIDAEGTAVDPIVFTSSQAPGNREVGDWGGLVLLGSARLSWSSHNAGASTCNGESETCVQNVEGINELDPRGEFGGNDDTSSCGTVRYVRIEFAGAQFNNIPDNELNSLTVGGCGSGTVLDHIQMHRGFDDGVEFFGGKASIRYFVITGSGDDGLDWDEGWRGSAENFVIHSFVPGQGGSASNGLEADNWVTNPSVQPRSNPHVSYGTIIGDSVNTKSGMLLRRGTGGTLDHLIVKGWAQSDVDIDDAATNALWDAADADNTLIVENSFFETGDTLGDADVDSIDEAGRITSVSSNDTAATSNIGDISGAKDGMSTPDYTSDITTAGAFGIGEANWMDGWTAFPAD